MKKVLFILFALMGFVQGLSIEEGVYFDQGTTNYTVLNSFSYSGDMNFTVNGLIFGDYTIKINTKTDNLNVGIYQFGLDYMDFDVNPVSNSIVEFNLTGFTDDEKIFIYKDSEFINYSYSSGLGEIFYNSNSFSSGKRYLFTKNELLIPVDTVNQNNAIQQLTNNLLSALTFNKFVCQVQIDNNQLFSSVDVDRQVFISEYTHMDYLEPGTYYVRVRCKQNEVWSFWSDTKSFMHGNKPIVIDWSIE